MLAVLLIYTTAVLTVAAQMNLTPLGNATQSSLHYSGKPQNAIEPPDSNKWSFDKCTHTSYGRTKAWWMFTFSFGYAYITDIKIYYREHFAYRMDGFKIYVTNTSTIPPDGYLCYEDPDPGLPNITQTIPCFQLGKYVIYYDTKGDGTYGTWGPTVELCYVVIKECPPSYYGNLCQSRCPVNCSGPCDLETGQCTDGCINGRFGETCELDAQCFTDSKMTNCTPEIYQLNPLSGPRGGGTILTISGKYIGSVNDSISIDISGVRCHNVTVGKPHFNGGATFTIRGEGFYNVEKITVERVDKHCDVLEDTSVVCKTPQNRRNQPNNQTVHVHFDDLTLPVNVEYVEDPTFEKFPVVYEYDKESSIQIKGRNILSGARLEDYRIHVGLDGSCLLTDIDMQLITCFPPKSVPRTNKTDLNTVHVIVDVGNIKAYIGDLHYKVDINTLAITVGIMTAALITAVVISVFAVIIIRKKKKRTIQEFEIELMTREEMIREASRKGDYFFL
ncbi:Hypothetical predicted protein [Mytilus galloprovincialis]|uniref:IPT/TIG domain-containing protein n=1 Tax=Mytilus galloprovincialis TaxID=29158 RepID=A0A8B6CJ31_MYTGA|nr:Hypothetical predicted protein [Mytilus galloprovincialis]